VRRCLGWTAGRHFCQSCPPGVSDPQSENQQAVDTKDLLERFDDDWEFLAELTGIFREEYPTQLRMI
jgi:hypothetical protein